MSLCATQGASSWRLDYLYDEDGTPYGGVYRSPASSTAPTYFSLVSNDHGDVLELCDSDGAAFAAYRYDAWGSPQGAGSYATGVWTQSTSLVTSALAGQIASRQVLRYASYCYDAESGLYYCSARYYDPATRQWTSADPAKADGEESAYQYCSADPIGRTDPTGEYDKDAIVDYAKKYWKNYNPAYRSFDSNGGDCTNFVSQAVRAGGWKFDYGFYLSHKNWWYNSSSTLQTKSWVNVEYWAAFAVHSNRVTRRTSAWNLQPGDILQVNFDQRYNSRKDHSMICINRVDGDPVLVWHSTSHSPYGTGRLSNLKKKYPYAKFFPWRT